MLLKNISKEFNNLFVLKNVNIELKGGLNFILGPSGSGKSTLLKIISGIDREYSGQVIYKGKNIKDLNKDELNSYCYNSVGFIWQNFQLIDHLSVEDNVRIVLDLSNMADSEKDEKVKRVLDRLGIRGLANKNVSKLSGGQKQRVAIARALVKDPEIIIADEPTGALDKKSSNLIMGELRRIAKERTVIVVTHDKSLVDKDSNCFLLKDGKVSEISVAENKNTTSTKCKMIKPSLSLKNAFTLALKNMKGLSIKCILTALILVMSSYFLLLNFNGTVVNEQQEILSNLILEKGDKLRDINIYASVISAGGTDKSSSKPNVNIEQNPSKVIEKYMNDPRVEFLMTLATIDDMEVTIDGVINNHKVESSSNGTYINKVLSGKIPSNEGREVAVTNAFLEKANLKAEDVIGKTLSVKGYSYDWSTGEPIKRPVKADELTIVGVVDSTVKYKDSSGKIFELELEDSFVYGLDVAKKIKEQVNGSISDLSFTMRVKDIEDIMPIVNELSKEGITAMGEFESVKDILSINNTTKEQSNSITIIIALMAVIATLVVTVINGYLRKSEKAILKINGYSNRSLLNLNIMEYLLIGILSIGIFVLGTPLINSVSQKIFSMSLSGIKSIVIGIAIIFIQALLMALISSVISSNIKVSNNVSTGDK
ncbi:MAG: ABC transporter ATP-binding protein/permease [Clostridium sp.]|uniref:ABC transporter ATP-binding protein/permease n=1 Tax=Clostridium sp. TaxID=1506 RepID=UPI00290F8576|nr:ABC transporter ATP-binding protein/permease [Clostridium sp.]MDU4939322.1 ABC transporter ATP-binding protein/permease [Clostridium sp.]